MLAEIYVDTRLGERADVEVFREADYSAHTKTAVFGGRRVPDDDSIRTADDRGWVAFTKDDKIRSQPVENLAFYNSTLWVLCLLSGGLSSAEQVERFWRNLGRIENLLRFSSHPWLYAVHANWLRRPTLYSPD